MNSKLNARWDTALKFGYSQDKREEWEEKRRRCQTDLYYLATEVLTNGESKGLDLVDDFYCPQHLVFSERAAECSMTKEDGFPCGALRPYPRLSTMTRTVHREICDFFIPKNPDKPLWEQSPIKTRLLFAPRGSFKSSIDDADVVQWIIGFPMVRIAIMCATESLSNAFVEAIKSRFEVATEVRGETVTYFANEFQQLFPECCFFGKNREAEGAFSTLARRKLAGQGKEPTLMSLSVRATKSGWHYDIIKFDDCVSDVNSGPFSKSETREKVGAMLRLSRSLVERFGYRDIVGTPYDEKDAYASFPKASTDTFVFLCLPAREVKPEAAEVPKDTLVESDFNFVFPSDRLGRAQLTHKALLEFEEDDPVLFAFQYMCNPHSRQSVHIEEDLIRMRVVSAGSLPQLYVPICVWDFAYSEEANTDYSVGVAGWMDEITGRCFVVDMVRGRFSKYELAVQVATLAAKWQVAKIAIEKSNGADFLETDIRRELMARRFGSCPLEFFPLDRSKGAKATRAERIETLLRAGLLWFSAEVPLMTEVMRELTHFRPNSRQKDDIVDGIAHLTRYMPNVLTAPQSEEEKQSRAWDIYREKQLHERMFSGPATPVAAAEPQVSAPTELDGYPVYSSLEEILSGRL